MLRIPCLPLGRYVGMVCIMRIMCIIMYIGCLSLRVHHMMWYLLHHPLHRVLSELVIHREWLHIVVIT